MMQGLGQLVASYGHLPPEKMQAFAAECDKGEGRGSHGRHRAHPGRECAAAG